MQPWLSHWECECVYMVDDSANDYNRIAAFVGSADRTSCCGRYCSRLTVCGVCMLCSDLAELKRLYELK